MAILHFKVQHTFIFPFLIRYGVKIFLFKTNKKCNQEHLKQDLKGWMQEGE